MTTVYQKSAADPKSSYPQIKLNCSEYLHICEQCTTEHRYLHICENEYLHICEHKYLFPGSFVF